MRSQTLIIFFARELLFTYNQRQAYMRTSKKKRMKKFTTFLVMTLNDLWPTKISIDCVTWKQRVKRRRVSSPIRCWLDTFHETLSWTANWFQKTVLSSSTKSTSTTIRKSFPNRMNFDPNALWTNYDRTRSWHGRPAHAIVWDKNLLCSWWKRCCAICYENIESKVWCHEMKWNPLSVSSLDRQCRQPLVSSNVARLESNTRQS